MDTNHLDRISPQATWSPSVWRQLSGRSLRFVLVEQIRENGTMTVAEMVEALSELGYHISGRPSKVISDALRWERARGRVVRVRRGVYRSGTAPRSTARRIKRFATLANEWIVAMRLGEQPPPVPMDRRRPAWRSAEPTGLPPWANLNWLWSS